MSVKRIMYMIIFIVMYICMILCNSNNIYTEDRKRLVKIVIVNSYHTLHPCTAPQVNGFLDLISSYDDKYRIQIHSYSMRTKIINTTETQMRTVASKIIEEINGIKPDIVFTTDDNACLYVGIPLSRKFFVVSSGLNRSPQDYINDKLLNISRNHNSIVFISEYMRLDQLWNWLDQNRFNIYNVYIITEPKTKMSTTAYYMMKNYYEELRGHVKHIVRIEVNTVFDLRNILIQLNRVERSLMIFTIQRIIDETGKLRNKMWVIKELLQYNKRQLELFGNEQFCRYGMAICNVPNFYQMGKDAANVAINYIKYKYRINDNITKPNNIDNCTVISSVNKLSINEERLKQLHYNNLLQNLTIINNSYPRIRKYNYDEDE